MSVEKQKTILLVDDEAIIAMTEKMALEKCGYRVRVAHSGEEAVAAVDRKPDIDLILMDINLGAGIDGTEAAAVILSERDIPMVFLSSHMDPEVVEKTEKITSYGYVVKNSSITVLDASIKMAFKLFEAKTREKEKEAALIDSESRFRRISSITSDIAYSCKTNEEGIFSIDWMTGAAERITGYSSDEIKEKGCWRFLVVEEDIALFEQNVIGLALGTQGSCELRIRRKNGGIAWIASFAECVPQRQTPERHLIYGGLIDITKRKQAEETYRNIFLNAQIGLFRTDIKTGLLLDANDCVARFIGYKDRVELLAKPFNIAERYVDLQDRERIVSLLKEHGEFNNLEARFRRNDGSIAWMRYSSRIVPEKGWMEGVSEDITKEKAMEESLRGGESRYRTILNASPDGISITDMNGRILMVSPALLAMVGCGHEEEMLGRVFTDFVFPSDLNRASSNVSLMSQNSKMELSEYRGLRADGSAVDLEVNGDFVRGPDGRPAQMVFIIRDISDRKRAESQKESALEAQRETQQLVEGIINAIPVRVFWKDKDLFYLGCNVAFARDAGFSDPKDIVGKDDFRMGWREQAELYRGDDRQVIESGCSKLLIEEPQTTPAGQTLTLLTSKIPLRNAKGEINGVLGTYMDITERKRAEDALRESEEWNKTILQTVLAGVMVIEADTRRIIEANDMALKLIGLPKEKVVGLVCHRFVCPVEEKNCPILDHGKKVDFSEKILLDADGKQRKIIKTVVPVQWHGRKYLIESFVDITQRKRAEEEIARQLTEKEILLREVHHRIKNNIASVGGLLSLHMQAVTNPEAIAVLQDAIGRVNSMRILYDKLLLTEGYKNISVKKYLEDLIDTIVAIFPDKAKIVLEKRIEDFHLSPKQLFPVGVIVNEIITNTMKHAFGNSASGLIQVAFTKEKNRATLTIQNNGNELPEGFDIKQSTGFGLMLVKMLCQQLGGSFSIETHAGTRCTIEFNA